MQHRLTIGKLSIGKVDGKHEFLTDGQQPNKIPLDSFLLPDGIDVELLNNRDRYYVEGFRGTVKTSLLRWFAQQKRLQGAVTDFILFKSDLTESQRMHLSTEVGISWTDIDPSNMEVSQDFKSAWLWFILHKIGENIQTSPSFVQERRDPSAQKALRLLGLEDESIFRKAIGFMPRLEGAHVRVRADVDFFRFELGGDFKADGDHGKVTLDALSKRISKLLCSINFTKHLYICFDELEAFYHSPEQLKRDQRLVRDLLFSVATINDIFRNADISIHALAAVRSEVVGAMGALGQEISRLIHDKGFLLMWHHARRSYHHPLLEIVRKKIQASEAVVGAITVGDPLPRYFPTHVNGDSIESFLLDRSFYKPRDIVWRLSLAQKLFPNETQFTNMVLLQTEIEYSSKLWEEVRYELSATCSDEEIDCIESVLSGGPSAFFLQEIAVRFEKTSSTSPTMNKLLKRRPIEEILKDLYRLGAIGNFFRVGSSGADMRQRWAFRGEPMLLTDKRMVIHTALLKRLSAVQERRRGVRGARGRGAGTRI